MPSMQEPQRVFADVVAAVVEEVAPGEKPMLAQLRRVDHDAALRGLQRRSDGGGLGFGWPEMLAYVTPAVYIALDQALRKVVDLSVEGGVRRALRRLRPRRPRSSSPPLRELTPGERRDVVAEVRAALERGGMPADQVSAVVDSLDRALGAGGAAPGQHDGGGNEDSRGNDDGSSDAAS